MSVLRTVGFVICFGVIKDAVKPGQEIVALLAVLGVVALVANDGERR